MTSLRAEQLLSAFRCTDPGHVDVMRRIEASAETGQPCEVALADVVAFLRLVTATPAGATSIDAVDFVHGLVTEWRCRIDIPMTSDESATDHPGSTRPSSSASGA